MVTYRDQAAIAATYHRAQYREYERTGVSWPFIRANCVQDDGTITAPGSYDPVIVGLWSEDSLGRFRVKLVYP